jgi:hypothetical protein
MGQPISSEHSAVVLRFRYARLRAGTTAGDVAVALRGAPRGRERPVAARRERAALSVGDERDFGNRGGGLRSVAVGARELRLSDLRSLWEHAPSASGGGAS